MLLLLELFCVVLLCDFLSGLGHWWEDTYGNPNWRRIGEMVIKPNFKIRFWRGVEWLLSLIGVNPLRGTELRKKH